jgi:hypothetical protein
MVTAVQAAVVTAAAAWVIGVGVAVYVMLKAARLMSETSTAVTGLRERGDLLIERANAAIDRAGEQIAKTETVTASMDGIAATIGELDGHLTALAPVPAPARETRPASRPLTWAAALAYGIRWAVGLRRAGRPEASSRPGQWPARPSRGPARARPWPRRDGPPPRGLPAQEAGRRAALTGRADGTLR